MESSSHLQDHIGTILKHEQDFLVQRTSSERLGDSIASFVGSLSFVALHVVIATVWIIINTISNTRSFHFDPFPFSLLGTCVSLEAILVASFIIMRQARLGRRADERDHLMLQILLLTEKEITAVVRMDQQIATRIGLTSIATDKDIKELSQQTSIDEVAQTIKEKLPPGQ